MSKRPEGTEQGAPGRGAQSEFLVENDDALAALVNLIAVIGDNVYFLGRRVSEWADAGPLLESAAACAATSRPPGPAARTGLGPRAPRTDGAAPLGRAERHA